MATCPSSSRAPSAAHGPPPPETALCIDAAASPLPDDAADASGHAERAPLTPLPQQPHAAVVAPSIAPPATSAFFLNHKVVPGFGIKMSAKEAKRVRRSEIEKRSRQRRQGSVSVMREELDRLERQYALLMARDENAKRGAIVDPRELPSMRARFLRLSHEAAALRNEDKALRQMLHEKQLFNDAVCAMLTEFAGDDAHARDAVAHAAYTPIDTAQCFEYMRDAFRSIARFESDRKLVSSGSSVMGWADKRLLVESESKMYFAFTKPFAAEHDHERLMAESWEMFKDEQAMRKTIFPAGVEVHLETLQVVSDDIVIMRRHTKYLAMQRSFHTVYLLFRVRTERGYTTCFRTIPCASVQQSLEDGESWVELFHWIHHHRVGDHVEVLFGGSIGGPTLKFAMHWMIELIMTVVRWENACIAPMFITSA